MGRNTCTSRLSGGISALAISMLMTSLVLQGCGSSGNVPQPTTVAPPRKPGHDAIPSELVQKVQQGDVVVIVGAGVSMSAHLPGFGTLLSNIAIDAGRRDLIRKVVSNCKDGDDNCYKSFDQFQFALANELGDAKMCELLGKELTPPSQLPPSYLQNAGNLSKLKLCGAVSFNWDNLLDHQFVATDFVDQSNFSCKQVDGKRPLLHIQGNIRSCSNIIVSEQDYAQVKAARMRFFSNLYSSKTALFLGMSITTYPLIDHGPWPTQHFAIMNDLTSLDRQNLVSQGITPISYNTSILGYGGMTEVLAELVRLSETPSSSLTAAGASIVEILNLEHM